MRQALQIPFVVIDTNGKEVADGLVDADPVEVPPGRYNVRIESAAPRMLHDISLAPGNSIKGLFACGKPLLRWICSEAF